MISYRFSQKGLASFLFRKLQSYEVFKYKYSNIVRYSVLSIQFTRQFLFVLVLKISRRKYLRTVYILQYISCIWLQCVYSSTLVQQQYSYFKVLFILYSVTVTLYFTVLMQYCFILKYKIQLPGCQLLELTLMYYFALKNRVHLPCT